LKAKEGHGDEQFNRNPPDVRVAVEYSIGQLNAPGLRKESWRIQTADKALSPSQEPESIPQGLKPTLI
jgi:hypothetical protein